MCRPRAGEANQLFSVYIALWPPTALAKIYNVVRRQRNLGLLFIMPWSKWFHLISLFRFFCRTSEILFGPVNLRRSLVRLSCDFNFLISLTVMVRNCNFVVRNGKLWYEMAMIRNGYGTKWLASFTKTYLCAGIRTCCFVALFILSWRTFSPWLRICSCNSEREISMLLMQLASIIRKSIYGINDERDIYQYHKDKINSNVPYRSFRNLFIRKKITHAHSLS